MNNNMINNGLDMPQFINKLKKEDKKMLAVYNVIKILYLVLISFLFIEIAASIFSEGFSNTMLGSALTVLGVSLIYIYLNYRGKDYQNIDYSQTIYEMLRTTSERYKPFLTKDLLVLPGIILMGIGMGLNKDMGFAKYQLIFWSVMIIGALLGLIYWYFKWKPVKDNADMLLKEIES